ncbi:c-type cytochrome [Sphingomonas baiyangensis]|uniref:Cytochrome c family protein n=1 Tax=Sphingomonas baiyangensis TaxID=2572576 RepID=A0A4U1L564_9SPHN|nr:cytochrome c family protein [Sphingomonas baiyangensis]TKD51400.1 cytochrome c family protein [Sphingomonas baiyangensis]
MDERAIKRSGWVALGVTTSALLLSACGGGGEAEKKSTTTTTTAATNTSAPAAPAAPAGGAAPAPDNTDTLTGATFASFTGDPASGKTVFLQCQTCHAVEAGVNKIGPSLAGIVGRAAGTVAGYNYTPANKNSGITWSKEKLFQYLENPQRVVPGTKMAFAGIADEQKRADVIEYLANPQ